MSLRLFITQMDQVLRTSQKHQLCEDALTDVKAREAERNRKKKSGINGERDCVSVSLSRIKHVVGTKAWGILFVLWFSVSVTK